MSRTRTREERARRRLAAVRFAVLAAALVATIAVLMLADATLIGRTVIVIVLSIPLVAGLYAVSNSRRLAIASIAFLVGVAALGAFSVIHGHPFWLVADIALRSVFITALTFWIGREVWIEEDVSVDTLIGGICVYLLVGFLFAHVYVMLEILQPGALEIAGKPVVIATGRVHPLQNAPELMYFSYTTLTTVAFGDIMPATAPARLAAMAEGMLGQLYPTIFIARLVSLYVAQRRGSKHPE